jgi:hypothetical protein
MNNNIENKKKKENPLLNIGLNIVIPTLVLTKLSKPEYLGVLWSLIIAMAFPLGYGIYDYIKGKKFNFFSGLGFFNVLMTGGIGLMNLDRNWMVVKETGVPLIMGLAVIISQFTSYPLVKTFLGEILNLDLVNKSYQDAGHGDEFERSLSKASFFLGGTFFISAILNYALAIYILTGEPGTTEFNESLGKMTALSFPVIALPMMIMVAGILTFLIKNIKQRTSLDLESVLKT